MSEIKRNKKRAVNESTHLRVRHFIPNGIIFNSINEFTFSDPEETTFSTTTAADDNSSFERYPISVQAEVQSQTQTRQTITSVNSQATVNPMTTDRTVAQTVQQPTVAYEEPREMCCGDYSDHRFPYFSLNRGCCNGKTFDTINLQCCDGVIKSKFAKC